MSTEVTFVIVPAGLGLLITAVLGLLKWLNVLPDDLAGKVALIVNVVVVAALTILVEGFGIDIEGEKFKAVFEILGMLGQILLTFLASWGMHKLSRAAKIAPTSRRS